MSNGSKDKYYALILGSSSGFGAATAIKLAEEGYNIIGVHLDRAVNMPLVNGIIERIRGFGVEAKFFNMNAADEKKRNEIIESLLAEASHPKIKVVMHSLAFGTLLPFVPVDGGKYITKAQMEMTSDVMAHSLVYWVQDLFRAGLLSHGGRIFGMTSSGGHAIIPSYGAVSAAKAALESHIRQLASELGRFGITANSIMAGVTDTPALRKIPGSVPMLDVAYRKNPGGRLTQPEDVARIIALLCKEDAGWVSGGIINVDGGEDIVSYVGQSVENL
jgi:NAD(P)-dependent dehydrogenase (short-subunit alcohol dehydrogenase family)